jgi:hypothetical protein
LLLGRELSGLESVWRFVEDRVLRLSLLVWGLTGLLLTALYFWPPAVLSRELAPAVPFHALIILGLMGFSLTPLVALLWRRVGVLFLGALLLTALVPPVVETVSLRRSPREVGRAVKAQWQPGAALVGVRLYSQGVSFYSGQVFHLLDFKTELDFGRRLHAPPGLFLANIKEMAGFAASRPRTFFYLKADELPELEREVPGKLRLVARHKDCILLVNGGK